MGLNIRINNNSGQVLSQFRSAVNKALETCGLEGESYAKMLCPVETGALRNSITHKTVPDEDTVYIGTNMEYAPYVELGTGIYASTGGGRETPWVYQDIHGEWHMTDGQRAQPYLKPAVADHIDEYKRVIEETLKGG